jgi:hypothetical protein
MDENSPYSQIDSPEIPRKDNWVDKMRGLSKAGG